MRKPNSLQKRLSMIVPIAVLVATLCLSSVVPFSSSSTQEASVSCVVDLDATHTITAGPGPVYSVTEIVDGGMYMGYYGGVPHYQTPESMNFTLHVKYNLGGAEPNLLVAIALKRNSSQPIYGETQFPNATLVILSPTQAYAFIANWSENGVDQVVSADYANERSTHHGTPYDVGVEAYPVNGIDINTNNNYAKYTSAQWPYWNASRLIGDIRSDGIVNILDAIKLSSSYGSSSASFNWNPKYDLDGNGKIDILDAILLSNNFGQHVP